MKNIKITGITGKQIQRNERRTEILERKQENTTAYMTKVKKKEKFGVTQTQEMGQRN